MDYDRAPDKLSGSGDWASNETLKSSQMNHIETELVDKFPDLVDGYNGGVWSPVNPIELGGDGVVMTGPLELKGSQWIDLDNGAGSPRQLVLWQPLHPMINLNNRWTLDITIGGSNAPFAFDQDDITDQGRLILPIIYKPRLGIISDITMRVNGSGAGSTHSNLPAGLPRLRFWKKIGTADATLLFSQTDTSASVGAYDIIHSVSITGISESINGAAELFYVEILGENGANAVAGALRLQGFSVTFDVSEMAP